MDIRTPVPTIYGGLVAQFADAWKSQVAKLQERFGSAIEEVRMPGDYPTEVPIIYVQKDKIVEVIGYMKSEPGFEYNFLSDITATDEEVEPRFEMVYNLFSHSKMWRVRVKARVRDGEEVPTLIPLWPGANWPEREVYDMFGIKFAGHPDMRRILMDYRWQGHPLRKDYPLKAYQIFPTQQDYIPSLLED